MSRFGRIINISGDKLFSDVADPSAVSSGGIFLSRSAEDDYARFRVPDTQCPPLPEPAEPKDSGIADEAEPGRWQWSGVYRSGVGWKFGRVQDDALNWIQPAYTCYDGDFQVNLQLSWSDAGLPRSNNAISSDFDLFVFEIALGNGYGICLGWFGGESSQQPWDLGVYAYVNGSVGTQLGWLRAGTTGTFRITRTGTTVSVTYVGGQSAQVLTNSSGQVQLRLRRDFNIPGDTGQHIPATFVYSIATASGAPSSVTVATPVIDLGTSIKAQPRRYPEIGTLEWRASDTPFGQNDSSPAWSNPTGSYRYWQARATWSQLQYLLERIEFISEKVKHIFTIRAVGRNIEVWHVVGRFKRGGEKGIVSIDRSPAGEYEEVDSERIVTIDR